MAITYDLQEWAYEVLRINPRHTVPTAWDHFFQQRKPALVRATLKDGGVVAGFYGELSFAAYSKDGRDLFLEHRWTLDDENWFDRPVGYSSGTWVVGQEAVVVEFYNWPDGGEQVAETERADQEGWTPAANAEGSAPEDASAEDSSQ